MTRIIEDQASEYLINDFEQPLYGFVPMEAWDPGFDSPWLKKPVKPEQKPNSKLTVDLTSGLVISSKT